MRRLYEFYWDCCYGAIEGKTQTKGEKMLNEKSLILRLGKNGKLSLDVKVESAEEAETMVGLMVYTIGHLYKYSDDYIKSIEHALNWSKEKYNDSTK